MNNHLPLNKTNYFNNLKKKSKNVKDAREQAKVNAELLNCIDILCNRYEKLLNDHKELSEQYNKFAEGIGMYINKVIVPAVNELADKVNKLTETEETEETEDNDILKEPEGGETMNA